MSNEMKAPDPITFAHLNVMFYLFIACYTDAKFKEQEALAIKALTSKWLGDDATSADVDKLVTEACIWYDSLSDEEFKNTLANSVPILKEKYPVEHLQVLIDDIEKVAKADGRYTKDEKHNVNIIKEILGLS
jgi:uncharacterized tellurite resistance protein B-like protein